MEEKTLAEIFDFLGFGRFQKCLLLIAGLGFMADAIEVGVITFLLQKVTEEWPEVKGWELNALSTSVFSTKLLGSWIWGSLSDHLGRRRTFLIANVFLLTTGCLSAAAPSYFWLVLARALVGLAIGGIIVPFDNLAESVPERFSGSLCFAIEYFWTLGTLYSNGLAALVIESCGWRIYLLLSALPIFLACIGYFFLEESPMWLLDRGYDYEAWQVLQRIGHINRKDLSGMALVSYAREADPSCKELLVPSLRRSLVSLGIIWWLGLFGYYGASLGSGLIFETSGSFDYGEIIFASLGEILGVTMGMCMSWQIPVTVLQPWYYLVSTLACIAVLVAHALKGSALLLGVFAFILRAASMGAISITWVLTPTAFPTHVRSTAHSILYAAGSLGPVCATLWPKNTQLAVIMGSYGAANLVCAIVSQWQRKGLAERGAFDSLISDLHASNLERRARSSITRDSRASRPTWASRPSWMSRPSWSERSGSQLLRE
ncbi:unnamed protein product [Durusdinium trenchii]|uniref:Major facilitator superfamily (MFS) profile domain-containing protein n=2 Tax=Durusdinium trenchii TaxID=1381693 RepID=A0ABP0KY29_9DINO